MASSLVSWIGLADLSASEGTLETGQLGPIASALEQLEFDQIFLIHDHSTAKAKVFEGWLKKHTDRPLHLHRVKLSSPTHFSDIHKAFDDFLSSKVIPASKGRLMFHLSPGTPAMAAVSILLGKTKYSAGFLQSSPQSGTAEVDVPFDIAAEFLPAYQASSDSKLTGEDSNDLPDVVANYRAYREQRESNSADYSLWKDKTAKAFVVDKVDIASNKYDLSINRYKEVVYEEEVYEPPKEILQRLKDMESEIQNELEELEAML